MIVKEEIILHLKKFTFDLISMDGGLTLCELWSWKEIPRLNRAVAGWPVKDQVDYIINRPQTIIKMRLYVGDMKKYPMRVEVHHIYFQPEYMCKWDHWGYRKALNLNMKEYINLGSPRQLRVEVTIKKEK